MPRAKKAGDLESLQGAWTIVSLEIDGQATPSTGARIIINGNNFRTEGMGGNYSGKVLVDPSRTPKSIDLQFMQGPEKGNNNFGIYELDGDSWKLCLDMTGKRRPAKFASGPNVALEMLKRGLLAQGREDTVALRPSTGATEDIQGEWALLECVSEGNPLPDSMIQTAKRVATANEITVTMGPQVVVKAQFSVNRGNQPNTIDYLTAKGQMQYGIFQVDGEILRTCFAPPGLPRPTGFVSDSGNKWTFTKWKKS